MQACPHTWIIFVLASGIKMDSLHVGSSHERWGAAEQELSGISSKAYRGNIEAEDFVTMLANLRSNSTLQSQNSRNSRYRSPPRMGVSSSLTELFKTQQLESTTTSCKSKNPQAHSDGTSKPAALSQFNTKTPQAHRRELPSANAESLEVKLKQGDVKYPTPCISLKTAKNNVLKYWEAATAIIENIAKRLRLIESPKYMDMSAILGGYKKALSCLNIIEIPHAIIPCTLISIVLACSWMFQRETNFLYLGFHCSDRERVHLVKIRESSLGQQGMAWPEPGSYSSGTVLHGQPQLRSDYNDVSIGVRPAAFQEYKSINIHYHAFDTMNSTKGHVVESAPFVCFNQEWRVEVYPGGHDHAWNGMASIFLRHISDNDITISFDFLVKGSNTGNVIDQKYTKSAHTFDKESSSHGWNNFIKSSVLTKPENLNHGTLTIELGIKLDATNSPMSLIPENPFSKHMSNLFLDEESADVLFELPSDNQSSKVQYHAHRLVLMACAPTLARLSDESGRTNPVHIKDIEPHIFTHVLQYVYGGGISPDWRNDAKKLIDVADKFGIAELKAEAEAWHVTSCEFTVDNVIDELLYADEKNCRVLREAALDFIVKNAKEVINSGPFENVLMAQSLTKEIMLAMAMSEEEDDVDKKDKLISMNSFRTALYEKGFGANGMLVPS